MLLNLQAGYRLFRWMVGGESAWKIYLGEYVKPAAGDKILDIGCGPADVLNYLPAVNYTGLDVGPEYIDSARKRFGSKGRFLCGDVGLATIEGEQGAFDLVLATGVIHHLDDTQATKLFDLARLILRPAGRLVTYDGCYVPRTVTNSTLVACQRPWEICPHPGGNTCDWPWRASRTWNPISNMTCFAYLILT